MKIDIWSDFACPFCYIGKRRLEKALEEFEGAEDIVIVWRNFQLDPTAREEVNMDIISSLVQKYNMTKEEVQGMVDQTANMAKEVGLDYNLKDMVVTNTSRAHRLANYAREFGLGQEMNERLFKAQLVDALNIADIEVLGDLAEEVGIKKEDAISMLKSDKYKEEVKADMEEARQLQISSVPFFTFAEKYAVGGAQSSEAFLEVLRKVANE